MIRVHRNHTRRGVAATELAVLLPFLMFMAVLVCDWGRIFYYTITLQYAARDGAYYASNYPGIFTYSSVYQAAIREAENLEAADITISCYSSTNTTPPAASSNWGGAYATYSGTPSGTPASGKAPAGSNFIMVSVEYNFRMVTKYFSWMATDGDKKFVIKRSVVMAVAPDTPEP